MQAINSNAMNFFVSFRITIIHLLAFGKDFLQQYSQVSCLEMLSHF